MTEEELHLEAHENAEYEVRQVLHDTFDDTRRTCRADVLVELLAEELAAMDDIEDVADTINAINAMMFDRAMSDMAMFNTVGSA